MEVVITSTGKGLIHLTRKCRKLLIDTRSSHDSVAVALSLLGLRDANDLAGLSRIESSNGVECEKFCAVALGLRGTQAIPLLLSLLRLGNQNILFASANALSAIGSKIATKPLLRVLRSSKILARRLAAIYALGTLHDPRSGNDLIRLAVSEFEPTAVRDFAVEALAGITWKRPQVIRVLLAALQDESPSVRWGAAWALGRSGDLTAIPFLEKLFNDAEAPPGNTSVAEAAREAIEDIVTSQRGAALRSRTTHRWDPPSRRKLGTPDV